MCLKSISNLLYCFLFVARIFVQNILKYQNEGLFNFQGQNLTLSIKTFIENSIMQK